MDVRTRFAPSPTGYLHVGGVRTALYNWLYARKMNGKYVLRIEDTDQVRSTEESMHMVIEDLDWLGLKWDEGPKVDGPHKPYLQSQRKSIYKEHADRLMKSGSAYPCFCTDAELEEKKTIALKLGKPPHYDGTCRNLPADEVKKRFAEGKTATVRFKVPHKDFSFTDLAKGEVAFPAGMVGDFVILRSDGMPVYNFCCVVDDATMKMSHVIRGDDHLSNTVRQIVLYEAFGYKAPVFGHVSTILGADKQRLSKRHGSTSCDEYRKNGYLPEAILNYMALLGWSPPDGQEIMTTSELIAKFDLDRFIASPAVFDEVKLKWVNSQHLRMLPHADLWQRLQPYFKEAGLHFLNAESNWVDQSLGLLKTSMETLKDGVELFRPLSDAAYKVLPESAETNGWESSKKVIESWSSILKGISHDYLTEDGFMQAQDAVKDSCQVKGKFLFMPIRVAVIGKPHGAELKQLVPLIPRKSLIQRAEVYLNHMKV